MSKAKAFKLDSEVEKCRIESNFKRLQELLPQIVSTKSSGLENLVNFLSGETLLELFLADRCNAADQNLNHICLPKADPANKEHLKKAKKHMLAVFDSQPQQLLTNIASNLVRAGGASQFGSFFSTKFPNLNVEAHLLLAKLYFLCAQYDEALTSVNKAKLDQDNIDLKSLRTVRLVAESQAIKGFCLENAGASTSLPASISPYKFQKSARKDQILSCFEKCADWTIKYLKGVDAYLCTSGSTGNVTYAPTFAGAGSVSAGAPSSIPATLSQSQLTPASAGQSNFGTTGPPAAASQFSFCGSTSCPTVGHLGPFIPVALQKVPIGYLQKQMPGKAIDYYRLILPHLDKPHTQFLQQIICQQFAQVLMRSVSAKFYKSPLHQPAGGDQSPAPTWKHNLTAGQPTMSSYSPGLSSSDNRVNNAGGGDQSESSSGNDDDDSSTPRATRRQSDVKFSTDWLSPTHINLASELAAGANGGALFLPNSATEEAFLLLSISETIACKEAILSRTEEYKTARDRSLNAVKSVQNLLTLLLSNLRQYVPLSEAYERSMKFAYDDHFIWFQFALALAGQFKYGRSLAILKQCLPTDGNDPNGNEHNINVQYLLASKLCTEQLGLYDQGLEFAERALKLSDSSRLHKARAHLLAGSSLGLKSQNSSIYQERRRYSEQALDRYEQARKLDPQDHTADFFSALQLALVGRLQEAADRCKSSLEKRSEQPVAIMLLALLLTADNQYSEALILVEQALEDFPTHYGLLVLRLKLEMKLQKASGALITAKELLLFWRLPFYSSSPDRICPLPNGGYPHTTGDLQYGSSGVQIDGESSYRQPAAFGSGVGPLTSSVVIIDSQQSGSTTGGAGTADSGATPATAIGVDATDKESLFSSARPLTEYGGAVSTVSDSLGLAASNASRDLFTQYRMQSNIWLELAELFLAVPSDEYLEEVQDCVDEACAQFHNSHQVLYLKGRLHQCACRWSQAKACYTAALALFPTHLPSWRRLAETYDLYSLSDTLKISDVQDPSLECQDGATIKSLRDAHQRMAERTWRRLVQLEPYDHESWRSLGNLLARRQNYLEAAQCLKTAVALEESAPLMPFNVIPRIMQM